MLGTAVIKDETDEHAHGTEMKRMWTEGSQGINSEHETRVLRTLPVKSLQVKLCYLVSRCYRAIKGNAQRPKCFSILYIQTLIMLGIYSVF